MTRYHYNFKQHEQRHFRVQIERQIKLLKYAKFHSYTQQLSFVFEGNSFDDKVKFAFDITPTQLKLQNAVFLNNK